MKKLNNRKSSVRGLNVDNTVDKYMDHQKPIIVWWLNIKTPPTPVILTFFFSTMDADGESEPLQSMTEGVMSTLSIGPNGSNEVGPNGVPDPWWY